MTDPQMAADLQKLGDAFARLHFQAINGVVCDPAETPGPRTLCNACREAWEQGTAILAKYDPPMGQHAPDRTRVPARP
jgi:hypothetical protein